MEKLAGLLSEGLNMGAKEVDSLDQNPRTTLTLLQLAYRRQKDSAFFTRFPAEIRHKVYECLLIAHEIITPDHRLLDAIEDRRRRFGDYGVGMKLAAGLHGKIVRTCRACVYETYPILYGQNQFSFGRVEEFNDFKLDHWDFRPCEYRVCCDTGCI